jgi:hypothetical protein
MQRREFITLIGGAAANMASRRTRAAARDAGSRISARRLAKLSRQAISPSLERSPGGTCTHGKKRRLVTAHTQS